MLWTCLYFKLVLGVVEVVVMVVVVVVCVYESVRESGSVLVAL